MCKFHASDIPLTQLHVLHNACSDHCLLLQVCCNYILTESSIRYGVFRPHAPEPQVPFLGQLFLGVCCHWIQYHTYQCRSLIKIIILQFRLCLLCKQMTAHVACGTYRQGNVLPSYHWHQLVLQSAGILLSHWRYDDHIHGWHAFEDLEDLSLGVRR